MSETAEVVVKPKYSIIIVNLNGLRQTINCIESILNNTKDFELIIVDAASDDGSYEYLLAICEKYQNFKIITAEKRYNFSINNNLAIGLAQGDFIIFLNNDTVVSPGWLDQMEAHFTNVPIDNVGCVGPVSNNSNGKQAVGMQDPLAWREDHRGQWMLTGVLYGWCMMFKREVIDKLKGFDESYENGHEDNDLCLRAQLAGYKLIIAGDTWIYHEGQATLRKVFDLSQEKYMLQGQKNREVYFDKYYNPDKKKLVAVYRTNAGEHLEESLEQTSKFADNIILHFCRAGNEFLAKSSQVFKYGDMQVDRKGYEEYLQKTFPKICKIGWYDGIFQEDYERNWLLQQALDLQKIGEADWCISIDDDEIYEDKFIGRVQKMMNPRNPETFAYSMNWRTIWKTELGVEYYRADDTFGQFINHRFFRLIPGQVIKSVWHPEGHHCGSAPLFGVDNIRWSNIRVRHLGYDTPEQRQKKFDFYQTNDHFKTKADIGHDDYHHLIDQNVNYQVYDPDLSISFVTMVKNEEKMILGMLEGVQDLVDEYIIVDTGSTDKTLEIINTFAKHCPVPVKVFYHPWDDNYSKPRNFGKLQASGKWILRMDADERFDQADMVKIFNCCERDYEFCVFHVLNYMEERKAGQPPKYASTESCRLYRNLPEVYYSGVIHETFDDCWTFLKMRRPVKNERVPIFLHHYGYLKNKGKIRDKMDYYEKLNNKQLEITEGTDVRPYFNLALHYLNDDKFSDALQNFQKCITKEPTFWFAHQQMAALNMKNAKAFLEKCIMYIPPTHPFKVEAERMLDFLNKSTIGTVKVT